MNDPIKQYREEHKREHERFERSINENLTIIIGIAVRAEEQVRVFREETQEHLLQINDRITRLDDRVTEAHRELAELRLEMNQKFDQILALLQNTSKSQP
jgi:hypothetical protein